MADAPLDHEAEFGKAFILADKQARFLLFLANPKRRGEVLDRLSHNLPYRRELATPVPGYQDFPDELEKLLRDKGAGASCHVIAEGLKADGRVLPLRQALELICMHPFGAVLSCIPGRLAYYRPEAPGQGILLERPR